MDNELIQIWIKELEYVYDNLLSLGVEEKYIKINPAIARWLGYYTWTVFETFIFWAESMWSIASWGRYENLAENFTKNNFPWVGGSIWLSRLIAVLNELWKIELEAKTVSQVMLVNMWENLLTNNLQIVNKLRKKWINVEIFLDPDTKIQKQLKYADNKKIPFVIIIGEEEIKKGIVQLKDLRNWTQREVKNQDLINEEFNN
jgi:histidyl-tRNA synthetase